MTILSIIDTGSRLFVGIALLAYARVQTLHMRRLNRRLDSHATALHIVTEKTQPLDTQHRARTR